MYICMYDKQADDDTYVIVENLRYFLSSHDPSEPVYFGHHFKTIVKQVSHLTLSASVFETFVSATNHWMAVYVDIFVYFSGTFL